MYDHVKLMLVVANLIELRVLTQGINASQK